MGRREEGGNVESERGLEVKLASTARRKACSMRSCTQIASSNDAQAQTFQGPTQAEIPLQTSQPTAAALMRQSGTENALAGAGSMQRRSGLPVAAGKAKRSGSSPFGPKFLSFPLRRSTACAPTWPTQVCLSARQVGCLQNGRKAGRRQREREEGKDPARVRHDGCFFKFFFACVLARAVLKLGFSPVKSLPPQRNRAAECEIDRASAAGTESSVGVRLPWWVLKKERREREATTEGNKLPVAME